ncbi:MAG: hypothetical protein JEZ09_14375 [Salinivirgaceae bacterium]|nr:hypothetical protein [Salinivirgaceae bacterium]
MNNSEMSCVKGGGKCKDNTYCGNGTKTPGKLRCRLANLMETLTNG